MRFIVRKFTLFSPQIEFLPSLLLYSLTKSLSIFIWIPDEACDKAKDDS